MTFFEKFFQAFQWILAIGLAGAALLTIVVVVWVAIWWVKQLAGSIQARRHEAEIREGNTINRFKWFPWGRK